MFTGIGTVTSVFRTLQLITSKLLPFEFFGFVRCLSYLGGSSDHLNGKHNHTDRENANLRFSERHFGQLSLGHNYGFLRFPVSVSKLALSVWISYSAMAGMVRRLPVGWRPELMGTPLHKLILLVMLWLHLCSAVPLLSALLTGLPLPVDFSGSSVLIGSSFQIVACLYYAICSAHW